MSSNLSDDEKYERIQNAKNYAKETREKYAENKYFSIGEAYEEVKNADGVGETTFAGAKLVGKSLFNIGRFVVGEALPTLVEETAKQHEKAMKK